jgi:hypothetical protein
MHHFDIQHSNVIPRIARTEATGRRNLYRDILCMQNVPAGKQVTQKARKQVPHSMAKKEKQDLGY